jgi:hypothetical protein
LLLGYYIRGKKHLLVRYGRHLNFYRCFLFHSVARNRPSQLALSVRRERLSRPPQTSVPVIVGLHYTTAQIKLLGANLNMRVLAKRSDLQFEPGMIIAQTPQGGERVDCGTAIGVTVSGERLEWLR